MLATGLSGLYSDLPRKIEIPSEDWFRITDEEVAQRPEMSMFLNTLEFCNAVAQVCITSFETRLRKGILVQLFNIKMGCLMRKRVV